MLNRFFPGGSAAKTSVIAYQLTQPLLIFGQNNSTMTVAGIEPAPSYTVSTTSAYSSKVGQSVPFILVTL